MQFVRKSWPCVASLLVIAFFCWAYTQTPFWNDCCCTSDSDGSKVYWVYSWPSEEANHVGKWRAIMLPGTSLGFSMRVYNPETKTFDFAGESKSKSGHPTLLEEVDDDYLNSVIVEKAKQVSDGNWCVLRKRQDDKAMWTVWSDELMQAVRQREAR